MAALDKHQYKLIDEFLIHVNGDFARVHVTEVMIRETRNQLIRLFRKYLDGGKFPQLGNIGARWRVIIYNQKHGPFDNDTIEIFESSAAFFNSLSINDI